MKKSMKWIVRIILGIVVLWVVIFSIDFLRCLSMRKPLFILSCLSPDIATTDGSRSFSCTCLGYNVNYSTIPTTNGVKQVTWIEFIMFGKRIMSKRLNEKENEEIMENNTKTEPYENIEGISVTTNIEN